MRKPIALLLALLALCPVLSAAESTGAVVGPMTLELASGEKLSGVLLDFNDSEWIMRVSGADRHIARSDIKTSKPFVPSTTTHVVVREEKKEVPVVDDIDKEDVRIAQVKPASAPLPFPAPKVENADKPEQPKNATDNLIKLLRKDPFPMVAPAPDQAPPPVARRASEDAKAPRPSFEQAIELMQRRAYKEASVVLRNLVAHGKPEEIAAAEAMARQRLNRPLAEVITSCYFNDLCPRCKGDGVIVCETCRGSGYVAQNICTEIQGPLMPGTHQAPEGSIAAQLKDLGNLQRHRRVVVCQLCRGNGYEPCVACYSTRLAATEPTPYERDTYTSQLLGKAYECMFASEVSYGDTSREAPPPFYPRPEAKLRSMTEQVWLRDSIDKVKSDLMRMLRAEGFIQAALSADPLLTIRSTKDYQQELNKIHVRVRHLWGELSERYEVYATNRSEHLLDEARMADVWYGESRPTPTTKEILRKPGEIIGDE